MRILTLSAALIATTLSSAAVASDWVYVVTTHEGDAFYINRDSIRTQSNGYKRAWLQIIYGKPTDFGDTYAEVLEEYDCNERRRRPIYRIDFNGVDGTTKYPRTRQWYYARPDNTGELLLEYVCFGKLPE